MKDVLKIIIGEDIPEDRPEEYSKIDFYLKNEVGEDILYAHVDLPYLINHGEALLENTDDPRYFFYEGYDEDVKGCRYACVVKPLGALKGVYRLGLDFPFKIKNIDVINDQEKKRTLQSGS